MTVNSELSSNPPSQPSAPADSPVRVPELLAPAGDWECARAAVENGADAIYFGLERFNARMRAHNFTEADLPELMRFLHQRGVRGYVTFNTLVFTEELKDAEQYLRTIIAAGVDAAIVQDIGICKLIRQLSPDFPIHASTQMTVTSAAGVEFARELGCNLVVLARECSLAEIEQINQAQLADGAATALPLEIFVHGALCVAYSGQCLTSEALGGRSANRGECAQACRLPYDLISDGRPVPLGDKRYLLSPQDLAGVEVLPDLMRAGVSSLKIEGRLKSPEYVASITRVYRQALEDLRLTIDDLRAPGDSRTPANSAARKSKIVNRKYEMEMAFSRGLAPGWLRGTNHQELVHARFGKKRGVFLGEVGRVQNETVALRLQAPLKPGDGIVFDAGHPDEPEEGGRVFTVQSRGPEMVLSFRHGAVDFSRIKTGDKVWKTSDPELDRHLRQTFEGDAPRFHRPVRLEVHGRVGEPLTLIVRDELGHLVQAASNLPLEPAQKQPLTTGRLTEQLGRLGGTAFKLERLQNHLEGAVILPVSELNRLRRAVVTELEQQRAQPKRWTLNAHRTAADVSRTAADRSIQSRDNQSRDREGAVSAASRQSEGPAGAELIVLIRHLDQLEAVLRSDIETVYCEFEHPKKYRDAVAQFRAWQKTQPASASTIWVAPPRIFKTGEDWILDQVRSSEPDGYLVRNYDHLKHFAGARRRGDFSLNVANPLTAAHFLERFGLERVTASYDLNFAQLEALLRAAPPEWFEVTIHQHMPLFHMEHCVFCAFMSTGTDYRNCGRPCEKHEVQLRDRVGARHTLKADAGCRNTVFNARAQTGAEYVNSLRHLGVRHFRLEFVSETPAQVEQTILHYRQVLNGEMTGAQLWRELKLLNQLGVTRGQM